MAAAAQLIVNRPTVNDLIRSELSATGVTAVFGLPGEDTISLIADLGEVGIRFVGVRHESAAVLMADGYSWATGDVGVCTVTRGPGLMNAITALRTAVQGKRRVLVITGDIPRYGGGPTLKNIDAAPLCASVGAEYFHAADPSEVLPTMRAAMSAVRQGRTAVFAVAVDILNGKADGIEYRAGEPPAVATRTAPAPSPRHIRDVLDLLASAQRPLIIAGMGASTDTCRDALAELAERTGALLGTSLLAKGLFTGNAYNLGVVGGYAQEPSVPVLAQVDLVLAFGASLNSFTTASRTLFKGVPIVQVDLSAEQLGLDIEIALGVVADAEATARSLLRALPPGPAGRPAFHDPDVLAGLRRPAHEGPDLSTADGLDPCAIVEVLDELLATDRVLVFDSGRFTTAPGRFLSVQTPRGIRHTAEAGSIGLGLGVALGAALGRPQRPLVLFAGDGGFSMAIADLETAARHRIPLVMIVLNDRGYGAEMGHLTSKGRPIDSAALPDINFAAVAQSFGVEGIEVTSIEHLRTLGPLLTDRTEPLLLSCRVPRDLVVPRVTWP